MKKVVARGSIRVDARRAVEKLREHLLLDLHLYPQEIVRAAVAGGARAVDVRHDADVVAITFDGDPLPPDVLPRLLDHVLDTAPEPESRRRRLLALGVNAALGLDPASVDLLSAGPEGCVRVRWTKALLEVDEQGAPASLPEPETIALPEGMRPGMIRVEVRRRFGWKVIRSALTGGRPREIALLLDAASALPAALTLAGQAPPARPRAVVRAPFELRGARRALLEIHPLSSGGPVLELLEHGVRLLCVPLGHALALPVLPPRAELDHELPLRLIVDADELPTNVSRSALREDAPLGRLAEEAAIPALIEAVRALAAALTGRGEPPPDVEIALPSAEEAERLLAAIARKLVRAARSEGSPREDLRALLDLPLLESAFGGPLPLGLLEATGEPLRIWRGKEPIPEALRPWLHEVIWLRSRLDEQLLAGLRTADARPLVDQARSGLERRRRLLERAPSAPTLAPTAGARLPATLLRVPFDVQEGDFAGLHGELAVFRDLDHARKIHAFVEGRLLESVPIDPSLVPLPIEAAITWEGKVRARLAFDGIEDDPSLRLALHYVSRVALFALDLEARKLASEGGDLRPLAPIFRAAIATHGVPHERFDLGRVVYDPPLASFKGLHAAPIWPTTEPESWVSAQALTALAERSSALFVARPGAVGRAPDGRPVLAVDPQEITAIAAGLGAVIVPYDDALIGPGQLSAFVKRSEANVQRSLEERLGKRAGPSLAFVRPGMRGRITLSRDPAVIWCHAGRTLGAAPLPFDLGPVLIAVDDDTLVPEPSWAALRSQRAPASLAPIERELCKRIVAALEGDARAREQLGPGFDGELTTIGTVLGEYLLDRVGHLRTLGESALAEDAHLARRIEALPLVTVFDEQGALVLESLSALALRRPAPLAIPALLAPPGFETLDWRPIFLRSDQEKDRLQRWSLGRIAIATDELSSRLLAAQVDRERRAFLTRPAQDPRDLGALADPGALTVFLDAEIGAAITAAVALPRAQVPIEKAWVDVLFQGRALCRRALPDLALPVVARVDLADLGLIHEFRDLSPAGLFAVGNRVQLAAERLAKELIARASGPDGSASLFGELRALRLIDRLLRWPSSNARSVARMLEAPADEWKLPSKSVLGALIAPDLRWPTVQGDGQPLASLHGTASSLFVGNRIHVPWRGPGEEPPGELDRPILHAPPTPAGEALRAICEALDRRPRDVSEALEKLQSRRAAAAPAELPRLPGTPAHPALRIELAQLGLRGVDGELEIGEGSTSSVTLLDPVDDTPRNVEVVLPFPIRILARAVGLDTSREATKALIAKLGRAAVRHLLTLAPRFDELPGFLRGYLRAMVCKAVAAGKKVQKKASAAPIFEDIFGGFHALDALLSDPGIQWGCTQDPPPYPLQLPAMRVLRLNEGEMHQLAGAIQLKNLSNILRRRLEGERRAKAPQVDEIALVPALRALCLHTHRVEESGEEGMSGEIGILRPEHAISRGIAFFSTRRPVCQLGDGPGQALVAAINDDSAPINLYFNGFRSSAASVRIQERVRALADEAHVQWLASRPEVLLDLEAGSVHEVIVDPEPAREASPPLGETDPPAEESPPSSSWMRGLLRAVRAFFGQEELIVGDSPLSVALLRAIFALDLPGRPVEAVVESRTGRALRYHPAARRLVLNRRSRALRWLGSGSHEDPRALALLAAAALSEISRELGPMTDEDERRALALLLARLQGGAC